MAPASRFISPEWRDESVILRPGPTGRARASLRALEALDRVTASGTAPSPGDLDDLRGWAGWGPMAPAFAPLRKGAWQEIGERLEWLLPPDQLREAEQATPNAFYTPPALAAGCWQILLELGFTGGRVLEPGCGAGAFMAATPPGLDVAWTGVERDPVTAQIARLLHPSALILNERIQNAALPAHSMDAVLGNVPFGETPVYDPTAPKAVTKSLHNYCIWRSARALKPGGVAILITSRYTMDARDTYAREAIAAEADLLGAIRLPGDALFPGGTEVVADIIVLRRPRDQADDSGHGRTDGVDWIDTICLADAYPAQRWQYDDRINQWFLTNPAMVLGEPHPDQAAQYGRTLRVDRPDGAPAIEDALASAGKTLAASAHARGLDWDPPPAAALAPGDVDIPQRADGRKENSFHLIDGSVVQVRDGLLVPAGRAGKEQAELAALIRLRDAAVDLMDAEADYTRDEQSLGPLRMKLNTAYDRYVSAYGPLNRATIVAGEPDPETGLATVSRRRPRMGGFRQDPDYVTVLALEDYDEDTGQAAKAPVFSQRVNQPPSRPTRAGDPGEAIRLCLDARGGIDLTVIGELLGIPAGQVPGRLAGLAYLDPASGGWVTAEEYLSGNVRDKLAAAREAAARAVAVGSTDLVNPADPAGPTGPGDPVAGPADPPAGLTGADAGPYDWAVNVAALERVQPADLGPDEIRARLGAPWIPATDVAAFATEILSYEPTVSYLPVIAQWEIKIDRGRVDTAAATEEWGTGRIDGYRLLELAVNGKAPVIYDTVTTPDGGEAKVRNQAETMLAEEKQRALAARFAEWAWEDPERCDRLCAEYNRRFNSVVLRRYDGSHLTFPGLAAGFTPYPHQLDMVHRIVCSQATLCPYPVGTGKTPVMFLAARKVKELGLASKPLIIVPNHLLEQTAREGKRLFPSARILMAAREDLADARARKLFAARCATGDWDAVVMTHSAFTAIPVHPATEAAFLTETAARYRQALAADKRTGNRTVKQLAKMTDAFETRAKTLLDHRTDDGVYFEHLGCDLVLVDESHYFKNLGVPVRTDGFSVAASKRATDLDMKLALLRQRGGKVGALFTGTPVSNSLLEMYILQHYLHPQRLEEIGLGSADAWAATFVEFQTSVEVTPDGNGFRLKRRPARFENIPELLTLFGEVADLRPPGSFAVRRPAARHHAVVITPSPELHVYVAGLADRADRVRMVGPRTDNMLKICSDGRKAALDLDLVGVPTSRPGKIGAVVANVARVYHATRDLALPGDDPAAPGGGLQIVFCDLGTPGPNGTQVYGKIRAGLIAAGVPAARIRFVHDATTDHAKAALFADCQAGKVSVLLGSTDKLGVGTNVQARCTALHHVDAPWRPADVEQREGRALRPGNHNPVVDLYRYVSEKSFDSFMWQTLERKARFIGQVLSGRPAGRDVDDIGDPTLSYAEVKALATGNPLLLELAEVNAQVTRLRQLAAAHVRSTRRLSHSVASWGQQITARTRHASDCDHIAATAEGHADQGWYDRNRRAIGDDEVPGALARAVTEVMAPGATRPLVSWRGLQVVMYADRKWRQVTVGAMISAGMSSITTELNPAWTAKGQHWRIEREIRDAVDSAVDAARQARDDIADLRRRISEANRRIAEPFPHAAELEAARVRRDELEQQIRDAAAPFEGSADDDAAELTDEARMGLAGEPESKPADAEAGGREEYTIIPVTTWPDATTTADDVARPGQVVTLAAPPGHAGTDPGQVLTLTALALPRHPLDAGEDQPDADAESVLGEPQPIQATGSAASAAAPGEPQPAAGTSPADRRPAEHPVSLAHLDEADGTLFSLPEILAAQHNGQAPRPQRTARPRSPRRTTSPPAAPGDADQPVLFDLPAPPAADPRHPRTPQRRAPARRR